MNRRDWIKQTRASLLRRREALLGLLVGELSRLGTDEDEESLDDEAYVQLAQSDRRELEQIDDALERIRDGRYGVCDACAKTISLTRLQALPYSSRCVACQRGTETGVRPHPQ